MNLANTSILFLDCQTTGMRPSVGHLLEMAWAWGSASEPCLKSMQSHLVQLPVGESIPRNVSSITGIYDHHLEGASNLEDLHRHFTEDLVAKGSGKPLALIHYAQFEKPFLEDFFLRTSGTKDLPFEILCSQSLAKKIFPSLPSRNIRGLSGYFGSGLSDLRRAGSHVQATFEIWKGLVSELNRLHIFTFEDLALWSKQRSPQSKVSYEYRVEKEKRLALPERPGIYRMRAKSGEILYVGKASSLKNRVNSYFRGRKGRDPKKLEMLTQVWDFDVIETDTALEAALLENDEIKRWDPPYNINLKVKERELVFYSHRLTSSSPQQDEVHVLGPFRPGGPIEQLRILSKSLQDDFFHPLFYQPVPSEMIRDGFRIFCEAHGINPLAFKDVRSSLAFGTRLLRAQMRAARLKTEPLLEPPESEDKVELSPLEVSRKFERLFLRAAQALRRARFMTKLLNCHIEWESEIGWKSLDFHSGRIQLQADPCPRKHPWEDLTISDYDRMSILLGEISKTSHRIVTF